MICGDRLYSRHLELDIKVCYRRFSLPSQQSSALKANMHEYPKINQVVRYFIISWWSKLAFDSPEPGSDVLSLSASNCRIKSLSENVFFPFMWIWKGALTNMYMYAHTKHTQKKWQNSVFKWNSSHAFGVIEQNTDVICDISWIHCQVVRFFWFGICYGQCEKYIWIHADSYRLCILHPPSLWSTSVCYGSWMQGWLVWCSAKELFKLRGNCMTR